VFDSIVAKLAFVARAAIHIAGAVAYRVPLWAFPGALLVLFLV
jgi:hypothetical protein